MGLLASCSCPSCGFDSETVGLGPAPYPDRFDPVLVSCPTCKALTAAHRPDIPRGCSTCGTVLAIHADEENVPCPRCRQPLQVIPEGIWD